jgi:hypothetical protein
VEDLYAQYRFRAVISDLLQFTQGPLSSIYMVRFPVDASNYIKSFRTWSEIDCTATKLAVNDIYKLNSR